ncbi:gamma-glutamylcyclotransferase family protein [Endozoicomonas sp. SCSIO W0465]|uniref:gamma-glutamylcyclotransferase family protein n=1 Tax=Endozoicomonas sp. SCSIO W0465 TaxID=2918516 RepID=UPI002075FC30|nr:gamma-glutamylcyclotransferase family protein [Endozoicomonas sp. SCSIO W0465]USE37222.1 gamma-glutamylcyclotransferase [Endozoicomonas sp. SCSIO W0465]
MHLKISLTFVVIMLLTTVAKADDDYAFIFGYGSLMQTPARTATAPDPEDAVYIPVKIRGVERLWNLWIERSQQRTLGVEPGSAPDAYVNGLIFAVKKDQLGAFDEREGPAYQRIRIPIENVSFYLDAHRDLVTQGGQSTEVFIYSPRTASKFYFDKGHDHKKIVMSYLDVVRTGCVEIDRKHQLDNQFINDCVQTMGLDGYVIEDDRSDPRYPRYPSVLLKKAMAAGNADKAEAIQTYIEQEWEIYLNTIYEKWGF